MSIYSTISSVSNLSSNGESSESSSLLTLSSSQIRIGNLEYDDIKQSIIDYMKRSDGDPNNPLKDYDFSSSAIQVLVDALAYNTLYYAFYSNMIANELYLDTAQRIESLISITKPLGFVVPYGSSARASISMSSVTDTIPKYAKFTGTNPDGVNYIFYTASSYDPDVNGDISEVVLFESRQLTLYRDITNDINLRTQTVSLKDKAIDINSISIEVSEDNGSTFTEYTLSNDVQYGITKDSRVYWIERINGGVKIRFSARGNEVFSAENASLETDNVGRKITATDIVRVTYFSPTGQDANNCRSFVYNDGTGSTSLRVSSFGGATEPNVDLVRFFAPKWFAAQGRAVTKNDYKAALKDLFPGDVTNPDESLTVFGGEEMDPPFYGRVFVSYIEGAGSGTIEENKKFITENLRSLSPVSILPEFIAPENFNLSLSYSLQYNAANTTRTREGVVDALKDAVEAEYGKVKFNNTFEPQQFERLLRSVEPAIVGTVDYGLAMTTNVQLKQTENTEFSFRNEVITGGYGIYSAAFYSPKFDTSNVFIADSQIPEDSAGFAPLRLLIQNGNLTQVVSPRGVGEINRKRGFIRIFPNVGNSIVRFVALPKSNIVNSTQNMVTNILQSSVTVDPI
tara:strand:- start:2458 stop:4335 length:1878 start_codon:yes stop_codon:yes gene_type:complete